MTEFAIGQITSTEENADRIVQLVRQDLLTAGLTTDEILRYAYPSVEFQRNRLADNPERYLGAYALSGDELAGFIAHNEWLRGDQADFEPSATKRKLQRILARVGLNHLNNRPHGIFGLVVSDTVENGDDVADLLLRGVIDLAKGREIRIAQYPGDSVEPVLRDNGFYPTGEFGIVVGLRQQLYVRDAS